MGIKRVAILIDRGPMETSAKTVWAHELPIIEALHGEGTVKVDPEGEVYKMEDYKPLDESEYSRLARAYGVHSERGISYVEFVFGHEREGKIEAFYMNIDDNLKRFVKKGYQAVNKGRQTVGVVKPEGLSVMDVSLLSTKGIKSRLDELNVRYSHTEKTEYIAAKLENAIMELEAPVST